MYHTCGKCTPLVRDFIEAGLDILQSLQPQALGEDLAKLKAGIRERPGFFRAASTSQSVLPHGTPAQVLAHVRETALGLSAGGGYIFWHRPQYPARHADGEHPGVGGGVSRKQG